MSDLEVYLAQVWSPDVRPLVEEAWRCYNAGATRASIAATWTAVTADIITKLIRLADEDDPRATEFRKKLLNAQQHGIEPQGVQEMQKIEDSLLQRALDLELIDSIGKRELQRIREDRNLCVHPALREFGEVYEPRPEVARSHLAVALTTLFIHPPTQGTKALQEFTAYMCDPYFVPSDAHMQARFFDRIRSATRRSIVAVAVKHALFEIATPTDFAVSPEQLADRMVIALEAFAARGRDLVRSTMVSLKSRFEALDGASQLRVLTRLGTLDVFWDMVDLPLAEQLDGLVNDLEKVDGWLLPESAATLALVRDRRARERLPSLEQGYRGAKMTDRLSIASRHPDPYFVPTVIEGLEIAWAWRVGEQVGRILLQHAALLSIDDLNAALGVWAGNHQCRTANSMRELAVELLNMTAHLGPARRGAFRDFIAAVRAQEPLDSLYRYTELEAALNRMSDTGNGQPSD